MKKFDYIKNESTRPEDRPVPNGEDNLYNNPYGEDNQNFSHKVKGLNESQNHKIQRKNSK